MTSYVHLRRYGKPKGDEVASIELSGDGEVIWRGRRLDLRTGLQGDWFKGFAPALDGRYLRYAARGATDSRTRLEIVHPDGRVVTTEPIEIFRGARFVGPHLVVEDSYKKPPAVIDETGHIAARLAKTAHNATTFDPNDGRTLWYVEQTTIAQYEIATQATVRRIEAPPGHVFLGIAVAPSGHVLTFERTTKNHQSYHSDDDRLVLLDAEGNRVRDRPGAGMSIAPLGERFVVSHHTEKRFVIYDITLEPVAAVAMFEPERGGHNTLVALPSGREWIAIGGRGEWDHYGEPSLAPTSPAVSDEAPSARNAASTRTSARKPSAKQPASKASAKKPASKPSAKKPAAKGAAKKR
jgi:hypothetical protein